MKFMAGLGFGPMGSAIATYATHDYVQGQNLEKKEVIGKARKVGKMRVRPKNKKSKPLLYSSEHTFLFFRTIHAT